jgi:hypothetical protein
MNRTTIDTRTTVRPRLVALQVLLLAVLTLLTTLVAVGPAAANQFGPTDFKQPEEQPRIEVEPQCDPDGFHYDMIHPDAPANAMYLAQWREAPNGDHHNLPAGQKSGFVQSGTGDFQIRGVILVQGVPYHQYDWVDVTVFCPGLTDVPKGDPAVTIDLEPRCDLDPAGVSYEIHVTSPPNGPTAYVAQWREGNGPVSSTAGPQGFLETGEGEFEVRGVLHHQGPGFYASEWTPVTVDCATEVKPSGEVEPGDDDPRPGNPNFTG